MTDRFKEQAAKVCPCHQEPRGCRHPDDQTCGDGCEYLDPIATAQALSEAYEAGRREEREECAARIENAAKEAKKHAETENDPITHDALCLAVDVLDLTSAAIRSRDATDKTG